MIWDYFRTNDPLTHADLERIGSLIYGDVFLKGLGVHAKDMMAPTGFPIITDVVKVDEFISPKVLWELSEPLPYHDFNGVIEQEAGRLQFGTEIPEQLRLEIEQTIDDHSSQFGDQLFDLILLKYRQNDIENNLYSNGGGRDLDETKFRHIVLDVLQNSIYEDIVDLTRAAHYGGLGNSPIFNRLLEAYETGGMPCGWLGPLPEDGGDPVTAIALLHSGRQVEP